MPFNTCVPSAPTRSQILGDLVREADLHGQESVGRILDGLSAGQAGFDQRDLRQTRRSGQEGRRIEALLDQWAIQFAQDRQGLVFLPRLGRSAPGKVNPR
jgi:hypothetical protein